MWVSAVVCRCRAAFLKVGRWVLGLHMFFGTWLLVCVIGGGDCDDGGPREG